MKIAIYGTSRSGKDYLIEHALTHLSSTGMKACHLKGSTILNEMAIDLYSKRFSQIHENEQMNLRREFIRQVDEANEINDVVFVDGHYAFPVHNGFKIVFTDADRDCYDHFFYLDSSSELIRKISRASEGEKQNLEITVDDIDQWKSFEKEKMAIICETLGKELVCLDEDTQACVEFIASWATSFKQVYDFQSNAKLAVEKILANQNADTANVIVVDCDKTLSTNDSTVLLFEELGIDEKRLKEIYAGDRYTSYQFFKVSRLLEGISTSQLKKAAMNVKNRIVISDDVLGLLKSGNFELSIALTAGLKEVWSTGQMGELHIDHLLGNQVTNASHIVSPAFKRAFIQELKSKGIHVTALGDSIIDIPMLEESNRGYIVAHSKLNKAVQGYFKRSGKTKIGQIFSKEHKYPLPQVNWSN